jgi:signal transduction histidine kinase
MEFEMYLRKLEFYNEYDEFENIALVFRKTLLPYFLPYSKKDVKKLVWVENIFQQMQMILQDKLINAGFRGNLEYNNIKLIMKDVGQILVTNFNLNNFKDSLVANLPRLGVRNCLIYLFSGADDRRLFDDYRLEFEYRCGKMVKSDHIRVKKEVCDFDFYLFRENRTYMYLAHLLYLGSGFMGFVLIDPAHLDLRIYRNLTIQIAMALNGIMLFDKLDASYRKLMDQAHRKGMADTTGILHNIANILNSVNVTTQSIESLMTDNAADDLLMANSLLVKNIDNLEGFIKDDPKGKMLMQYYVTLADEFDIFRGKMQTYIGRLADKVGLIEGIVNAQQSYTDVKPSLERLDVIPVIEDVLNMHQASIERHGVYVEKEYAGSVIALAQRTKLFHILTNIVKNGIESMDKTEQDGRVLSITVSQKAGSVFIRISDSGEGIAEGNLENIFAYGFTTKKYGHGFGLHSCANYMTEMKGRIWAENKENGWGATFVLQFTAPSET